MFSWTGRADLVDMRRIRRFAALGLASAAVLLLLVVWDGRLLGPLAYPKSGSVEKTSGFDPGKGHLVSSGIVFLAPLDDPCPRDLVSGSPLEIIGAEAVKGRFGNARFFDGLKSCFADSRFLWSNISNSFSISMWVAVSNNLQNQDIVFAYRGRQQVGVALQEGMMTFHVPLRQKEPAIAAYDFRKYGEFVHLTCSADFESGFARVFENGALAAEVRIEGTPDMPPLPVSIGKRTPFMIRAPFAGVIDDVALWNRALSGEEAARLWRSGASTAAMFGGWRYFACRVQTSLRAGLARFLKIVDMFNPFHAWAPRAVNVPEISVFISKSDRRFFSSEWRHCLESGILAAKARKWRSVLVGCDAGLTRGEMMLWGSRRRLVSCGRPSFVLTLPEGASWNGMSVVRLYPPEDGGFLMPLVERRLAESTGVPCLKSGICKLRLNGRFAGIYLYEDYQTLGTWPGSGTDVFTGPLNGGDLHRALFWRRPAEYPSVRLPPMDSRLWTISEIAAAYRKAKQEYASVLAADRTSPLPSGEIMRRIRDDGKRLASLWKTAPEGADIAERFLSCANEYFFLGANHSPFLVRCDIKLSLPVLEGLNTTWSSSRPDLLGNDGRILRLPEAPETVDLTLKTELNGSVRTNLFRFRLVPEKPSVPALVVYAFEPVRKTGRVSCAGYIHGTAGAVDRIAGLSGGGIRHRGNTSYWKRKKPFSLSFDEKVAFSDGWKCCDVELFNHYRDLTFLRGRLSYDIFRSFGSAESPRYAPFSGWVELFLNGKYEGLYVAGDPDNRAGGDADAPPAVLYRREPHRILTPAGRSPDMRQILDPGAAAPQTDAYRNLTVSLEKASSEEFAGRAAGLFDLGNVADFEILLNVTQNVNGWPFDYMLHDILARDSGAGGLFFFIPWDFDATFQSRTMRWCANGLQHRLHRDYPGYSEKVAGRWAELRNGPLSDRILLRRVDELAEIVRPYAAFDLARWESCGEDRYDEAVNSMKTNLLFALDWLDSRFSAQKEDESAFLQRASDSGPGD